MDKHAFPVAMNPINEVTHSSNLVEKIMQATRVLDVEINSLTICLRMISEQWRKSSGLR